MSLPAPKPAAGDRSLLDLNRRDFIMLTAGGGLVALAIGVGVGLAKLFAGSDGKPPADDKPDPGGK